MMDTQHEKIKYTRVNRMLFIKWLKYILYSKCNHKMTQSYSTDGFLVLIVEEVRASLFGEMIWIISKTLLSPF